MTHKSNRNKIKESTPYFYTGLLILKSYIQFLHKSYKGSTKITSLQSNTQQRLNLEPCKIDLTLMQNPTALYNIKSVQNETTIQYNTNYT